MLLESTLDFHVSSSVEKELNTEEEEDAGKQSWIAFKFSESRIHGDYDSDESSVIS